MTAEAGPDGGLLAVRGLAKSYRLGSNRLPVVRGVSLSVAAGEMVVIMGPSGSGKTTLLNCISGIDVPDDGDVSLAGEAVDYASEGARTLLRRNRIGMVFQFFNLIPTLTVRENVALPFYIGGEWGRDADSRVDRLLQEVGMDGRREHYPFQLSGGEMQLTSIARALVHRPDLLLADEPTGNVNPHVGRTIMELLRSAAAQEGAGMLMMTHSPEHAAWADRVCFLKDGVIAPEHRQGGRRGEVAVIHERLLGAAVLGAAGTLIGLVLAFPAATALIDEGISTTGRMPSRSFTVPWAELAGMGLLSLCIALLGVAGPARVLYRMRILDVLQPRFMSPGIDLQELQLKGFGWMLAPLTAAGYLALRPFIRT